MFDEAIRAIAVIVVLIGVFAFGLLWGRDMGIREAAKDCMVLGKFRAQDGPYECRAVGKNEGMKS